MRLPSSSSVAGLLLAVLGQAHAQYLVNDLSFGSAPGRLAPAGETKLPNFSLTGSPRVPEILSDKVILTPPAPGGFRGAIWSEKTVDYSNWIIDVEFRVSGPERGAGNLNIWLVRDGEKEVGAASIYTAARFEGLALVVDQFSGQGMIRGFLNDGTKEFRQLNTDSLAFGNCYQSYRNLGRPMQLKLRQTARSFKVEVDGRTCFESETVIIPAGYQLGITAATSDNPDSFEVFKVVTMTDDINARDQGRAEGYAARQQVMEDRQREQRERAARMAQEQKQPNSAQSSAADEELPDADPDSITSSKAQFADLHNRLQGISHVMSSLLRSNGDAMRIGEQRQSELASQLDDIKSTVLERLDKLATLEQRLSGLEREVKDLRGELSRKIKDAENSVKGHLSGTHQDLSANIKHHAAPGHGRLILVVIASQLLLAGGYVVYKRRKTSPKKYL